MSYNNVIEKPLCIIPARGGSKRISRKNISLVGGKTLLTYAIESAIRSDIFSDICVSSEDEEILDVARKHGVSFSLKRPPELATDNAQVKQVCIHLLEDLATEDRIYGSFAVLLTTNPFRTAEDIKAAYELFLQEDANYVMSLVPYSHPPQRAVWLTNGEVKPYFGMEYMKQTQLLETLYRHDGSFIFAKTQVFLREKEFYGSKTIPYFISPEKSVDIDNPIDLKWAEFLLSSNE